MITVQRRGKDIQEEEGHTVLKMVIPGQKPILAINSKTGGWPAQRLKAYNDFAKSLNPSGKGAYGTTTIYHAEADAIFQAYEKGISADSAVMYCDRPLCGYCKNSLANLFCLIGLKNLTWYGPNDTRTGYVQFTWSEK